MNHYVLLLDDNKPMLEIARAEWRKHGIGIVDVKTVSEAIDELPAKPYALIIVVADHVGAAMCSVLKTLRVLTAIPILILSTKYMPHAKIAALELGADEYLTVSNTIEEDVITGYALIRRHVFYNRQTLFSLKDISSKDITICRDVRIVFVRGIEVKLTATEFEILELLMTHRKRILPYEAIFRTVWGDEYEDSPREVLHNHITRLRKKIRAASPFSEYIRSEPGIGYAFNE
jgi:DNA-binding response OmpR family regulator